jgi:hypothetical protein
MQRAGLEWFHRLVRNPRRLARRYLIENPPVLFSLAYEGLRSSWLAVSRHRISPAPVRPKKRARWPEISRLPDDP